VLKNFFVTIRSQKEEGRRKKEEGRTGGFRII
jgi:hypothetical protein